MMNHPLPSFLRKRAKWHHFFKYTFKNNSRRKFQFGRCQWDRIKFLPKGRTDGNIIKLGLLGTWKKCYTKVYLERKEKQREERRGGRGVGGGRKKLVKSVPLVVNRHNILENNKQDWNEAKNSYPKEWCPSPPGNTMSMWVLSNSY